ncbi:MAG: 3-phosphoshikimate 1-carboxyvinyltransferase [Bacteroidia bacterium]|nr:MAG: 3-phosphoshikimate 1-carboxyvinyltransferase [Bacteroidia bacterium]
MDLPVRRAKPLLGDLHIPGDKSISHRAALLAALGNGTSVLHGFLEAQDPHSTIRCLRSLGIRVETSGEEVRVHGRGLRGLSAPTNDLHAGNSGTTLRLLSGILAGHPFESVLTGDDSLRRRPMNRIVEPLTLMGASVKATNGKPPVRIRGKERLKPISYTLPVPSAQVKSAILLAGLYADGVTTVEEPVQTRDHTERMLGLQVQRHADRISVSVAGGMTIPSREFRIPGDISSAVFLIAAAACIKGSDCVIRRVGINPTRSAVLDVLQHSGVRIEKINCLEDDAEPLCDLHVAFSPPEHPVHIDPGTTPLVIDEIPALAVLAACARVGFSVEGAGELRVKESDRIALLSENLRRWGIDVREHQNGFRFDPPASLREATIESGGDHRIAMAFAVAGMVHGGITINEAECADVSFPGFWNLVERLVAGKPGPYSRMT